MSVRDALPEVSKILLKAQEEMKDKKQELELSVITNNGGQMHVVIDRHEVDRLMHEAQAKIEEEQMDM